MSDLPLDADLQITTQLAPAKSSQPSTISISVVAGKFDGPPGAPFATIYLLSDHARLLSSCEDYVATETPASIDRQPVKIEATSGIEAISENARAAFTLGRPEFSVTVAMIAAERPYAAPGGMAANVTCVLDNRQVWFPTQDGYRVLRPQIATVQSAIRGSESTCSNGDLETTFGVQTTADFHFQSGTPEPVASDGIFAWADDSSIGWGIQKPDIAVCGQYNAAGYATFYSDSESTIRAYRQIAFGILLVAVPQLAWRIAQEGRGMKAKRAS